MVGQALRQRATAVGLALCCLWPGATLADEPEPKAAAKQHFDAGNARLAQGDVAAALGEFLRSRALFPTRGNTQNAAIALQRLGRFDEALELYASLPRDFELDREQRERVEREIELLRGLTGSLSIQAEAGVSVSIDGRERGTAPFREPLVVLGGSHTVRARQPGRRRYEQRVDIVTGAEQELVIAPLPVEAAEPEVLAAPAAEARPLPAPIASPPVLGPPTPSTERPPPAPPARLVFGLDFGPAFGLGFGGPLAESCSQACQASVPLGFAPRARGGFRFASRAELGLELGYARLSGSFDERPDTLEPRGAGQQPGASHDALTWSAWSLGGYAGWIGSGRLHARALFGFGISFARVRDERRGRFSVAPPLGDDYTADVRTDQRASSKTVYLAPELGAGLEVAPRVELSLGVTLTSSIVVSPARFTREGVVVQNGAGEPELAYLAASELTGSVVFAVAPRLGVSARF